MLSLHTNNAALSAQNAIAKTQSNLSTAMTRLSTGLRINAASDDAAGLQIATRLKAQTSGMAMAMKNTQNATSMLQTASGSFTEVTNMLIRMKDLATQAADSSSSTEDKTAMQSEYDALGLELGNVMNNTTFGGTKLLTGGTLASAMTFQIGASQSETMAVDVSTSLSTLATSIGAASANFTAAATGTELTGSANATIGLLTTAINDVGTVNSALGATINRLDHVNSNLSNISTNTESATGRIMDTDFATESANMTSNQMLLQAGTAMLKQSNSMSSLVMSLLQ
ncbi:Lateral flagellin [Duganella sp. Leaf126]|uniref:flagellin N-terminal helical domain-containing protein n=1 Tax=Duganella sp. Leaf126 TaxID=1736266 RepID=UPI0006F8B781|nr:flagellin [Duganella sp. Leaf126]KQQ36103.1 Lateral flagellin [Duganella sp. Leaf126]